MAYRMAIILSLLLSGAACVIEPLEDQISYSDEFVNKWWEFTEVPSILYATFGECFILNDLDGYGGELLGFSESEHIWLVSDWWYTVVPNIYRIDEQFEMGAYPREDDCWDIRYGFLDAKACICTIFPRIAK